MTTRKLITVLAASAALAGFAGTTLGQDAGAAYKNSRAGQAEATLFATNPYWYNKPGWRPGDTLRAGEKQLPAVAKDAKEPFAKSRAGQAESGLTGGTYHMRDNHNQ